MKMIWLLITIIYLFIYWLNFPSSITNVIIKTMHNAYEESPRGATPDLTSCHFFLVTSDISPETISCAIELRF